MHWNDLWGSIKMQLQRLLDNLMLYVEEAYARSNWLPFADWDEECMLSPLDRKSCLSDPVCVAVWC